jgi:SAM-dependent methyltransferase
VSQETAVNLRLWDGWADLHMSGTDYDVEGFVADPASRPFDWVTREVVGDVAGKRLLHLQSHIGIDTLRFALAGAVDVTGVDFSPRAVAAARSIAARLELPVQFVEADVTDLPDSVPEAAFDVVFTSYGTITWLPELEGWARMIASRLAPGGVFHIIDTHPFLTLLDDVVKEPQLRVRYPYFSREPLYFEEQGSYADRGADFTADSYEWQHTLTEIIGSLLSCGLQIQRFSEYPVIAWKALEFMEKDTDGLWRVPPGVGDVPLMFALSASRPLDPAR